jgi:hypothetical protein
VQHDEIVPVVLGSKTEVPLHILRFQVGELLPWKGIWFEVTDVTVEGLTLKARKPIEKKHG